jgi:hypothetical protein
MSVLNMIIPQAKSSAKVADGRLILTLPDAQTPVIWIMDLNEATTSVLRIESDQQNLHVIKKLNGKSAADTVGVYASREKAEAALQKASKALAKAQNSRLHTGQNNQPVIIRPASRAARIFTAFLYIWFALYLTGNIFYYFANSTAPTPQTSINQQAVPTPQTQQNTDGVPQSADEFLQNSAPNIVQ